MSPRLRTPLRGAAPIVLVTALVAVLGLAGTAGAARLITGSSIKDGSITAVDLSKKTRTALKGAAGAAGARGIAGDKGDQGSAGPMGMTGTAGAAGSAGANGMAGAAGAAGAAGSKGLDAVSYFAAVPASGTSFSVARGVTGVTKQSTGSYLVALTGLPNASTCVANAQTTDTVSGTVGGAFATTLADGHVAVSTFAVVESGTIAGVARDHAFVLTVSC